MYVADKVEKNVCGYLCGEILAEINIIKFEMELGLGEQKSNYFDKNDIEKLIAHKIIARYNRSWKLIFDKMNVLYYISDFWMYI